MSEKETCTVLEDLDGTLRMPRRAVVRRNGTLMIGESRIAVVSPTAEELSHIPEEAGESAALSDDIPS